MKTENIVATKQKMVAMLIMLLQQTVRINDDISFHTYLWFKAYNRQHKHTH